MFEYLAGHLDSQNFSSFFEEGKNKKNKTYSINSRLRAIWWTRYCVHSPLYLSFYYTMSPCLLKVPSRKISRNYN